MLPVLSAGLTECVAAGFEENFQLYSLCSFWPSSLCVTGLKALIYYGKYSLNELCIQLSYHKYFDDLKIVKNVLFFVINDSQCIPYSV